MKKTAQGAGSRCALLTGYYQGYQIIEYEKDGTFGKNGPPEIHINET
jgi:hypothetical protein